jgi:hypothetical protein
MKRLAKALTVIAAVAALGAIVRSQEAAQPPKPAVQPPPTVKVDITLTRSNGNKTLSNLPYSLYAAQGNPAILRLGSQVPIVNPAGPVSYQDVGSNIDCRVTLLADGRYQLNLSLDDSSLSEGTTPGSSTPPVIRSYRITTMLVLRNGEATPFNVATDKVSGDTIRAQVTVTALK